MKRRDDPNQTLINWSNPAAAPVAPRESFPDPAKLAAQAPPQLIQYLPWDFSTTFPQPTEEAINCGVIDREDCTPAGIRSIHDEQANELFGILRDVDKVMDARRRGIDSTTGKVPRTHASREHLKRFHQDEPKRWERYFNVLMETYENAFGVKAADAFAKCIRARHAGIPVVIAGSSNDVTVDLESLKDFSSPRSATKRKSSILPVPKPLPEAISAGHFGMEDGKPLKPTTAEVRAITERHVARGRNEARVGTEVARLRGEVKSAIDRHAESFGQEAGERLEAYCRRQQTAGRSFVR